MKKIPLVLMMVLASFLFLGCTADKDTATIAQQNQQVTNPELKTDSGTYVGQIDANSIEIKVSGVPEESSARAFQLSDSLKNNFDKCGLNGGEEVIFKYQNRKDNRPIIIQIEQKNR